MEGVRFDVGLENVLNKFYAAPLGGAYVGQGPTMSGSAIPWGIPIAGVGRAFYARVTLGSSPGDPPEAAAMRASGAGRPFHGSRHALNLPFVTSSSRRPWPCTRASSAGRSRWRLPVAAEAAQ